MLPIYHLVWNKKFWCWNDLNMLTGTGIRKFELNTYLTWYLKSTYEIWTFSGLHIVEELWLMNEKSHGRMYLYNEDG